MSETKVELEARLKAIPINESDAPKSQYVCSYLVVGANLYELRPAKYRRTQWTWIGRFHNRLAQTAKRLNAIQLESALSNRKRKANEMEEDSMFVNKILGIVTDAEKCTLWNAHSTIKTGKDSNY
ncbi:uncharacterized protein OCT59_000966 [Rhizophagus irregularis]|uniref:uncharacterized protein n=1 Tax=Rhizophagus irregularis TaxID=588596 RepID=UPI003328F95F|nr:hypothetical protein OCT59_000966 [Rhizophagus irregularis]